MTIANLGKLFVIVMLLTVMGGVGIVYWTADRANFFNQRISLAHTSYERHLQLRANTYKLFKRYGDTILIGNQDQGAGAKELIKLTRQNISDIRTIVSNEIEMVGEEEYEELEALAKIELKIEELISKFQEVTENTAADELGKNWVNFSAILDGDAGQSFRELVDVSLEEELEEVIETREEAEEHAAFAKQLVYSFAVLATVFLLFALWFYRQMFLRPLDRLMVGVRNFASGRFDKPINIVERSELGEVATVLDDMASKVEARTQLFMEQKTELEYAVKARTNELERLLKEARLSSAHRRQLLADVSHELRTPLTIIQGESEIALRGGDKAPEEYREALRRARDAAVHTSRLVNDLLFISRKESGEARLKFEELDLKTLILETVEMTNMEVSVESGLDRAPATADSVRVRQSIIALLQNAMHHGGPNICVKLDQVSEGYRISVEDNGPGLADAEKEKAFERFFRGSNAAGNYAEGSGLGLPVVRSIAEAHGGAARLEDRPEGGTIAIIDLPKRPIEKADT